MTIPRAPSLRLYALATRAVSPFAPILLRWRAGRGREDPARLNERLGHASLDRPDGRLVWMHAVSVGEALSLTSLIDRVRATRPDRTILITTGTRAAADLLAPNLSGGVIHQYAPLDTPGAVRRFLDHWRPECCVLVESELWPNLILEARGRGMTVALVSARMSKRSLSRWRRAPDAARTILEAFDLILAKDTPAAEAFAALGGRVRGIADLKFGAPRLPAPASELAALRGAVTGRPVVVAASTHVGEEALIMERFAAVAGDGVSRPLLILAPRHERRGAEIEALARRLGFNASRRSGQGELYDAQVYVADTLGELGLWYRLADLAILGGSFVAGVGGHNPLEPARLGCPFVAGPHVEAWPVYEDLAAIGATVSLRGSADLDRILATAINDPAALAPASRKANDYVATRDAAALASADQIVSLLPA